MSLFKFPKDGWQQIEKIVLENPKLLRHDHYHTLPHGTEALTEEEIMKPYTAHCLFGWVIAITPRAAAYERQRIEVIDYANEILVQNGQLPLPLSLAFYDEESMLKIIRGRAPFERIAQITSLQDFAVN